jgi:hypothetical protein
MRYAILILLVLALCTSAQAAATIRVYKNGEVTVAIPAGQYINVAEYGGSSALVYKEVGGPSHSMVPRYTLETSGTVTNGETSFGPYTYTTNIKIRAGEDGAWYSVGAGAAVLPCMAQMSRPVYTQAAPVAVTGSATLTADQLMNGIITDTHSTTATATYILPTGTLMDTATGLQIDQGFEWSMINLSSGASNTVTLSAGSGHTIVGVAVIQSTDGSTGGLYGASGRWFTRKTAANTFVTYRIR